MSLCILRKMGGGGKLKQAERINLNWNATYTLTKDYKAIFVMTWNMNYADSSGYRGNWSYSGSGTVIGSSFNAGGYMGGNAGVVLNPKKGDRI